MTDPNNELRYLVRTFEPDGFMFDPDVCVGFSSLDEARRYCREQSEASEGLLSYCLFDFFDGVELDY